MEEELGKNYTAGQGTSIGGGLPRNYAAGRNEDYGGRVSKTLY